MTRVGFVSLGRGGGEFPVVSGRAAGNQLPGITGTPFRGFAPGPHEGNPGQGGQLGAYDGTLGADPRAPKMTYPGFLPNGDNPAGMDSDTGNQHPSWWRGGLQGFSDRLTVKDRHAYYDTGNQKTGVEGFAPSGSPNAYNDAVRFPPRPDLRTVNRTVSYQKGSDTTRNQDDLTRAYTPAPGTRGFIGEQGSGWTKINGGVPGLYQPYGTRGGVPYPIVSPAAEGQEGDGPHTVFAGPPHGLHSQTPWKGGAQIISRTRVLPQMRPVRIDRPSNSPQAGQSYSQTVRPQGASRVQPAGVPRGSGVMRQGRGWSGTRGRSGL